MYLLNNWFFCLFVVFYFAYLLVEIGLDIINLKYIDKHKNKIPDLFANIYSKDDYQKSIEYTKAKTNFRIFQIFFKTFLLFTLIITGFFEYTDNFISTYLADYSFVSALIYPFVIGGFFTILGIPESYYFQFVIEEKFGFNKMDFKTFIIDTIKSSILALVFGIPLLAGLLWFINNFADNWWIFGAALILGFQLFTAAIYPVVLAPIFNKFTPLIEGNLKDKITDLAKKVNFKMSGIFTIDGSKRSSHSNAYFAGMGSMKRIVLFDTLINKHSEDEIVAVIAHEMGHNVKKHIQKSLILSSILTFIMFYALFICLKSELFFHAFGVNNPSNHVGLVLFFLFSSVFMFPISPLFTKLSRKNEFEADNFAVITTKNKTNLSQALVKLTKENLGNLTPHPLYSAYHYSHPTTIERVEAINKIII